MRPGAGLEWFGYRLQGGLWALPCAAPHVRTVDRLWVCFDNLWLLVRSLTSLHIDEVAEVVV